MATLQAYKEQELEGRLPAVTLVVLVGGAKQWARRKAGKTQAVGVVRAGS